MKPNRDFTDLSQPALARSRADWLYGMNMTRASPLTGQRTGVPKLRAFATTYSNAQAELTRIQKGG